MHPKMLESVKSKVFVPKHDQEQRMGSFCWEQAGGSRRTRGHIVTEGESYQYIITVGASWTAHASGSTVLLFSVVWLLRSKVSLYLRE
jgi:hypothetical protein